MKTQIRLSLTLLGILLQCTLPCAVVLAADSGSSNNIQQPDQSAAVTEEPADYSAPESTSEDNAALRETLLKLGQYEKDIMVLENSQGAYGADIGEIYLDYGITLQSLGRNTEAALAFGKALQAVRVSNGLNDLQQLVILQKLQESNNSLQNWEDVDISAHLMFHISKNNYQVGHEKRVQALQNLGRWKMEDASKALTASNKASAPEALGLFKNEITLLESTEAIAGRNIQLASMYLGRAEIDLWLADRTNSMALNEFQTGNTQRTITTTQCQMVRIRDGSLVQICNTIETPDLNYYLEPAAKKSMEVRNVLDDMKGSVLEAYNVLQTETAADMKAEKDALLAEVVILTEQYNAFVNEISSRNSPVQMRRKDLRESVVAEE